MSENGLPAGVDIATADEHAELVRLRELANSYIEKRGSGKKPTQKETRAFEKLDRQETKRRGKQFCSAVPKGIYLEWAGRTAKTVGAHQKAYGMPGDGRTVDIPAFVRWVHWWFIKYKDRLPALVADDFDVDGEFGDLRDKSLAKQIEVLERRLTLLDMDIDDRRSQSLPREQVHEMLSYIASQIRGLGEIYAREFGNRAVDLLNDRLADIEQYVRQQFEHDSDSTE